MALGDLVVSAPDWESIRRKAGQETADAIDWLRMRLEEEARLHQQQKGTSALGDRQDRIILMGAYGQ